MCGVTILQSGLFALTSPYPRSSQSIRTMLGRSAAKTLQASNARRDKGNFMGRMRSGAERDLVNGSALHRKGSAREHGRTHIVGVHLVRAPRRKVERLDPKPVGPEALRFRPAREAAPLHLYQPA